MSNFSAEYKKGYTDGWEFAAKYKVMGNSVRPQGTSDYCNGYYEGIIARLKT